jgi:hypothetical protein
MALVFHRGLALPLWAMVFFTVALTPSPPATPFLIAVLGIAVITFAVGGLVLQLRTALGRLSTSWHRGNDIGGERHSHGWRRVSAHTRPGEHEHRGGAPRSRSHR